MLTPLKDSDSNGYPQKDEDSEALQKPASKKLPLYLPVENVTLHTFNKWKTTLLECLQQNDVFKLFLPGGLYSSWQPGSDVEDSFRIQCLHEEDPARVKQEDMPSSRQNDLLKERNYQLSEFIEVINVYSNNAGRDPICDHSTSFELIIQYLLEHHSLEHKFGGGLFHLCHMQYSESENVSAFYSRFRGAVCDVLRKKGDTIQYLHKQLGEDETLSPTFEDVIILWCLEKIDPRLPMKVFRTFCSQLMGDITVRDLQEEIFNQISQLLTDGEINDHAESGAEEIFNSISQQEESEGAYFDLENMLYETEQIFDVKNVDDTTIKKSNKPRKRSIGVEDLEMDTGDGSFLCKLCDVEFETRIKLRRHRASHKFEQESDNNKCCNCDEDFSSKSELKKHVKQVHDSPIECKLCKVEVKNITSLGKHMIKEHGGCKCDECEKEFKSIESLRYHKKLHAGTLKSVPSNVCPRCGVTIKHHFNFKRHLDICQVPRVKNIPCEFCGKLFATEKNLKSHLKYNHEPGGAGERFSSVYKCDLCGKDLKSKESIRYHMKRHANKIPSSVCPRCGITLKHKTNLKRHLEICQVERVRNMPCQICGKLFSSERNLQDHIKRHHENSSESGKAIKGREFPCETCHRTFFKEEDRGSHVCKHFSCDICDAKFIKEKYLKRHKLMHAGVTMFPCPLCEALFEKKKQLNGHKRITHSEKRNAKCEECHKTFKTNSALNKHMFSHQGEKPFKCVECGKAFLTKANLQSHSMVHTKEYPLECENCGSRFRDVRRLKEHRERQMCGVTSLDMYNKGETKVNVSNLIVEKESVKNPPINFELKIIGNES